MTLLVFDGFMEGRREHHTWISSLKWTRRGNGELNHQAERGQIACKSSLYSNLSRVIDQLIMCTEIALINCCRCVARCWSD